LPDLERYDTVSRTWTTIPNNSSAKRITVRIPTASGDAIDEVQAQADADRLAALEELAAYDQELGL
jgi:hypothetical protein